MILKEIERRLLRCHKPGSYGRGFNEAVNGFADDGWSALASDGMDDVSVVVNANPNSKLFRGHQTSSDRLCSIGGGILCAKASMLLQVSADD